MKMIPCCIFSRILTSNAFCVVSFIIIVSIFDRFSAYPLVSKMKNYNMHTHAHYYSNKNPR